MSFYLDANKESVPLTVMGSDFTADYMFSSYSKTGDIDKDRKCLGTNGYLYHNLLNDYLFVSSGPNYYVCKYKKGADASPIALTTTGLVTGTITRFLPYMIIAKLVLYVLVTDATTSVVVRYIYTPTGPLAPTLERTYWFICSKYHPDVFSVSHWDSGVFV
jgi:hypothetical protein